jgi:membrane-associated phospholipid phosphatase
MTVYGSAFALWLTFVGLPTDYGVAFGWLWLATIAWNHHRPWRHHWWFVRDWTPILVLLVVYDLSRGAADQLLSVNILPMIHADRGLFGVIPTVWLQDHLYVPGEVRWWDVGVSFVYFSHFVVSLTIAVVLWLRNRAAWLGFMRRFFLLTTAGLATYVLFPAAPPWYAAKYGYIDHVVYRMSSDGWHEVGMRSAGKLIVAGQALSNPVAAMPSLHSAFALFVVAFFFPYVRRRWIPVLLLYPLAMLFTLVYSGEHYVADVLVGWSYVALTFAVMGYAERWWAARHARELVGAPGPPVTEHEHRPLR